jgi:hypothetical protein
LITFQSNSGEKVTGVKAQNGRNMFDKWLIFLITFKCSFTCQTFNTTYESVQTVKQNIIKNELEVMKVVISQAKSVKTYGCV